MRKTDIKIKFFTLLALLGGAFWAFPAFAGEITVESVVGLINQEREKAGLVPLVENGNLSQAAQAKAQDMLAKDYFAHTSPEGLTPWHWIEKAGYDYKFAGENLAINFKSVEKQNEVLMESATHRKNILGEQFNEIGVAVVGRTVNGKETIITVQQFGNRGVAVSLPEKKNDPAGKKEISSEAKRAFLIDSSLVEGKNNFIKNTGNKVAVFRNEVDSLLGKAGSALKNGNYSLAGLTVSMLFAVVVAGSLEVLRRFHGIVPNREDKNRALYTVSLEEYGEILQSRPFDAGKMRLIYLHQMKRRE